MLPQPSGYAAFPQPLIHNFWLYLKYTEAEPLYQRALAIWEKALGPEHPNVATSLENYAALLRNMNREAEAVQMEAHAKAIRGKSPN